MNYISKGNVDVPRWQQATELAAEWIFGRINHKIAGIFYAVAGKLLKTIFQFSHHKFRFVCDFDPLLLTGTVFTWCQLVGDSAADDCWCLYFEVKNNGTDGEWCCITYHSLLTFMLYKWRSEL